MHRNPSFGFGFGRNLKKCSFLGDLLKNATHAIQRDTTRHKITGYSTNCIIQPCPVSLSNQIPTRHTFFCQRDTSFSVSSQLGVPSKATGYTQNPTRYIFFLTRYTFSANAIHLYQLQVNLEHLIRQRDTLRTQRNTHFFNEIHFFCQSDTSFSVSSQLGVPSKATHI